MIALRTHHGSWSAAPDRPPAPRSPARAVAGVVLALISALLLLLILTGVPGTLRPGGGVPRTETVVYRIDARDVDGNFAVYEWGTASGPRRAAVLQTRKRECRRKSVSHTCRATVEATFDDHGSAVDHRRTLCRNHRVDHGRLPVGMTSC